MTMGEWIMSGAELGLFVIALIALNKKSKVKVDQPVTVKLIEELHNQFAAKKALEDHIALNREDHNNLFSKIGGVERGTASSIESKIEGVRRDLIAVGNQVSALKSQTDMQNTQLGRMETKLDRVAERKHDA